MGRFAFADVEHASDLVEPQVVLAQRAWIELDPHRRERAAADVDLADALDLRQPLRDDRRREVVHTAARHRVRRHRQNHDGRVGGVHLAIGRVAREVRRQLAARGVDRGLDIARSARRCRDPERTAARRGRAQAAGRGHLAHAGDPAELALERRRHARRHRLRAGARQARVTDDRREVDLRERRDRQQPERQHTREGERRP